MSIQKTTGGKVFTEKEVKKYMLEYGVEINQTKDSISFNGREKDIDKVKSIINRDSFLEKNKQGIDNYISKKNNLCSKLDNLDYRADYNRAVKESTPVRKDYSDKHYCL